LVGREEQACEKVNKTAGVDERAGPPAELGVVVVSVENDGLHLLHAAHQLLLSTAYVRLLSHNATLRDVFAQFATRSVGQNGG
jgi:hypothetical protein